MDTNDQTQSVVNSVITALSTVSPKGMANIKDMADGAVHFIIFAWPVLSTFSPQIANVYASIGGNPVFVALVISFIAYLAKVFASGQKPDLKTVISYGEQIIEMPKTATIVATQTQNGN